ncbi:hypothetical protein [Synechococcus sp. WH 8016]|uniref:hypothetical protein n=1 Tax=Synechococcus sp. WH 8016 TaxID=166318 RepID=UPI00022D8BD7|nr:hypothetical protein [Synechococcus sp. WH 8016]EHA63809.1 hypothetical protein Syn8016DRAFT_0851 [Synechococcus sp. WH 8016]
MDNRQKLLAGLAIGTAAAPHVASVGYAAHDLFNGEVKNNVGEAGLNYFAAGIPALAAAGGGLLGSAIGHGAYRLKGRPRNELSGHRAAGAMIGGVTASYPGAAYAIDYMDDSTPADPGSITQNIPMQEMQEISDLLGANGAY